MLMLVTEQKSLISYQVLTTVSNDVGVKICTTRCNNNAICVSNTVVALHLVPLYQLTGATLFNSQLNNSHYRIELFIVKINHRITVLTYGIEHC